MCNWVNDRVIINVLLMFFKLLIVLQASESYVFILANLSAFTFFCDCDVFVVVHHRLRTVGKRTGQFSSHFMLILSEISDIISVHHSLRTIGKSRESIEIL